MVVTGQAVPLILVMLEVMFGQSQGLCLPSSFYFFKILPWVPACIGLTGCLISSLMLSFINIYLLLIISIFLLM